MMAVLTVLRADHQVEHVFFRQKSEVHMTRSQWIVGLVLDFKVYEKYLIFTNNTLNEALRTARIGQVYFNRLTNDYGFRETSYLKSGSRFRRTEKVPLLMYCDIIAAQVRELVVLQELHQRNWQDFKEITRIGHSELEQNRMKGPRQKRVVGILAGIVGIFSGFSLFSSYQLKKEVRTLRENQNTIRTVLKDSLSLINLTRMEVRSNRIAINQVIEGMGKLVSTFEGTVIPLREFVINHAQLQTNIGMARDLVTAESDLIAELQQKVSKLATGRLSPILLPAPELVQILKGIEVEIPPELMLPQDPRERPFYYYKILTTNTIALEDELVIAIEIPLLDVARKLKIMEAIALPVPYSETTLTAVYDLEFTSFAISLDGRQYVVLTLEDQLECGKRDTNYCSLTSAVQEANSHSYCTLALYQRDQAKVAKLCKVKVSNKMKLPTAYYIAKGEWLVATNFNFNLRRQCVGVVDDEIVQVKPPYTAVELKSGCRALADAIELPIYFRRRQEYRVQREGRIVSPPKGVQMRDLTIWSPVSNTKLDLPANMEKLGDIKDIPIEDLVKSIENLQDEQKFDFPDNVLMYALIGAIIMVIIAIVVVLICKRRAILRALTSKPHHGSRRVRDKEIAMMSREEVAREMRAQVTCHDVSKEDDYLEQSSQPELPVKKKRRAPRIHEDV